MEKGLFLVLVFVCHSHQRPQLELDTSTTVADTTDPTTEETTVKSSETVAQVTEATAVSVKSSVNFSSSYVPSEVYEDFKPSNYYRPDGNPIYEKPSTYVNPEIFHGTQHFQRPNGLVNPSLTPKPDDKNIVFPQASHDHIIQHSNRSNGPEFRSPYKYTEIFTQPKPMKHDYGETVPKFSEYDNSFYEKYFGRYYGNEMSHYPDLVHEPPKSYHSVAIRHKKDPWRSMLSVLATILPVGLLLASFPPTVIKVNSTQYPSQFQKNATLYNPNAIIGRYRSLKNKKPISKTSGDEESPRYLDDCSKKKICESIKTNYTLSELDSLLQNNKLNLAKNRSTAMVEIAEAVVSTSPESCQVFVCNN
uniref:Uncharacterized protein n=1 Tax=Sipha flava TaxID=143950 RepID=A0A2S2QCF8_9HEMI